MKKRILTGMLCFILGAGGNLSAGIPEHPLLEQTRRERAPRLQFALENGAHFELTPDGKTFYLWWLPEGHDPQSPPPMIATLSGHDGWAVDDFFVWHTLLQKRGYGLMAVQWWLGQGERPEDYLRPDEIYRIIDGAFQARHVPSGTALLHGFSRGATNVYTVAALDRNAHKNYFALIIANAGQANLNYPPVREVASGIYGPEPLKGTHWVTYAGKKDPNPARDGIAGMRATGDWIRTLGGTLDLAIEDSEGGHGGFHQNPQNAETALSVFETLRVKNQAHNSV